MTLSSGTAYFALTGTNYAYATTCTDGCNTTDQSAFVTGIYPYHAVNIPGTTNFDGGTSLTSGQGYYLIGSNAAARFNSDVAFGSGAGIINTIGANKTSGNDLSRTSEGYSSANPVAPDDAWAGLIQNGGGTTSTAGNASYIQEKGLALQAGYHYTLSFQAAERSNQGRTEAETLNINLTSNNGASWTSLGTVSPAYTVQGIAGGWQTETVSFTVPTTTTYMLEFDGNNTGSDSSVFITNLGITGYVPAPPGLPLFLSGFSAVALRLRRRLRIRR